MTVDHRSPLHDGLCRCTNCKPSLVGQEGAALTRVRVAALVGAMLTVVLILAQQVRP